MHKPLSSDHSRERVSSMWETGRGVRWLESVLQMEAETTEGGLWGGGIRASEDAGYLGLYPKTEVMPLKYLS